MPEAPAGPVAITPFRPSCPAAAPTPLRRTRRHPQCSRSCASSDAIASMHRMQFEFVPCRVDLMLDERAMRVWTRSIGTTTHGDGPCGFVPMVLTDHKRPTLSSRWFGCIDLPEPTASHCLRTTRNRPYADCPMSSPVPGGTQPLHSVNSVARNSCIGRLTEDPRSRAVLARSHLSFPLICRRERGQGTSCRKVPSFLRELSLYPYQSPCRLEASDTDPVRSMLFSSSGKTSTQETSR